ncbi:sigma 54-interacting transcriptional regulator [Acuticoccus yangtzensis]|uniref:sigma 54-interacting transcriptional regulator n=1 Tax=Acuticoccus yangtzensis TaxID=1443441 RepID=UPI0009F9CD03|nr:sigma 54-interacting transcriptional regulator [Acuticoccus yangtzensis]
MTPDSLLRRPVALDPVADLLERSEAGILALDPIGDRIAAANATAATMLGHPGAQLRGQRPSELFRAVLPALLALTEECMALGHAWHPSLMVQPRAEPQVEVEVFASLAARMERTTVTLLMLDARRQRRRHAKREFERLYRLDQLTGGGFDTIFREIERGNRLILDAAGDGIYGVNARGETTFVNPAAEAMLGWKAEDLIGALAHSVFHHSHEDGSSYAVHDCPIYAAFRDGTVHRVEGEVFWRRDGTSFPVDYTSTPIYDDARLVGAVVLFRDVSERLAQERRITSALAEVERLRHRLELENAYLTDEIGARHNHHRLVGSSAAVEHLSRQIDAVAASDAAVLVTGEPGSGRELVARAIHDASARRQRPFVRVHCAAETGLEDELFGHAAAAGAHARVGRYELADGGTLFLQDVAALPFPLQVRLARAIEEGRFERTGDDRPIAASVRLVASAEGDLAARVEDGNFYDRLYWRLATFPIAVPALRERREDVRALAQHVITTVAARLGKPAPRLSVANLAALEAYGWPGNVRELETVVERAVIVARDERLHLDLGEGPAGEVEPRRTVAGVPTADELRQIEREAITTALARCRGRVSGPKGAATLLGLKPTTLYSRLKRLGIEASDYK